MPTRALTWAIFAAAAGIVAAVCVAILRPFAHVIAWAATRAILSDPLQQKLVERTGRVAVSALLTSVVAVLACLVPLLPDAFVDRRSEVDAQVNGLARPMLSKLLEPIGKVATMRSASISIGAQNSSVVR